MRRARSALAPRRRRTRSPERGSRPRRARSRDPNAPAAPRTHRRGRAPRRERRTAGRPDRRSPWRRGRAPARPRERARRARRAPPRGSASRGVGPAARRRSAPRSLPQERTRAMPLRRAEDPGMERSPRPSRRTTDATRYTADAAKSSSRAILLAGARRTRTPSVEWLARPRDPARRRGPHATERGDTAAMRGFRSRQPL